MNELDYLLIVIILLGVGIGLRRGLIRVLIGIVGIYFTVIVAGYVYEPFGDILAGALDDIGIGISDTAAHNFIYLVVIVALTVLVEVVSRSTFEETRIRSIRGLDNLLGGVVGIFYGALWASLFLVAPQYGVAKTGGAWNTAVVESTLVPELNQFFQDAVLRVARVFFFGGMPELYLNRISQRVVFLLPNPASLCYFPF